MRRSRDGDSTREIVIQSAREVFAERGFQGASLKMISDRCGVSTGLILHHFKSKKDLHKIVLAGLASEYFNALSQAGQGSGSPDQAAETMLRETFKFWNEDTAYQRMSLWAYLENQAQWVEGEMKLTAWLASAIRQMQAAGMADSSISPFVLLTMTIGPIDFWMRYKKFFKEALQLDGSAGDLDQMFLEQYLNLIRKIYRDKREERESQTNEGNK